MKDKKLLGNILLLITAVIWGTAFAFQRSGMDFIQPITFTASRMTLAAVFIGLLAFFKKALKDFSDKPAGKEYKKSTVTGGVFCGIFLALASIFQQMGIVYTTAGKAGFITAMYILLVPVLSLILFKKHNTWLVWLAVLTGVAGMYFLCINESFCISSGDALICVCAALFSGHILTCDYFATKGDPLCISAIQFTAASVISWIAAFVTESPDFTSILSAVIPIIYCGVVSGGIGYTLQIIALKYTDPTVGSLIMSLESVFALIAGALLLQEHMSPRELIGCLIMLVAIIMVQIPLPSDKQTRKQDTPR